jgi:glycosyltransferase involved in cell wall biosynthesis
MGGVMRVLVLLPDFVLPAERGFRVRILSQLRAISDIPSVEDITVLSMSEVAVPDDVRRSLGRQVPKVHAEPVIRRLLRIRRSMKAFGAVVGARLLRGEPYLIATNESGELRRALREHLRRSSFDIVYFGLLGMTGYLHDVRVLAPRARAVLEQHNVEWQIFDRLASSYRAPLRQLAQMEARALRRFERRALSEVDSVIAISEDDARHFRGLAGVESVVVPPFIEARPPRMESRAGPTLGYIGHLGWQPNVYGLDWFCQQVWPRVRSRVPDARLTIAGPGLDTTSDGRLVVPGPWQVPGVTAIGYVDDLETLYSRVIAMIAPVVGGSGVRMKLLESMSAGMPTVTTTDGAAGLGVVDGREMLVADGEADFADGVVRLLQDRSLRDELRTAGYDYLAARHSLAVARRAIERAFGIPSQASP